MLIHQVATLIYSGRYRGTLKIPFLVGQDGCGNAMRNKPMEALINRVYSFFLL